MLDAQVLVAPISKENRELVPGELKTLVIHMTNESNTVIEARGKLLLPDQWRLVNAPQKIRLEANSSKIVLLSIVPFRFSAPGQYSLSWSLTDLQDSSIIMGTSELVFELGAVAGLEVGAAGVPEYMLAGEAIQASFVVKNTGNTNEEVTLTAKKCALLSKGDAIIEIGPGESRTITTEVKTPEDVRKISRMSFRLDASVEKKAIHATAYQHLQVYPTKNLEKDKTFRLPGTFSLAYVGRRAPGGDFQTGIQGELAVSGNLDKDGERNLGLRIRGPDQFEISGLGQYQEYYLRYQTPHLDIGLGDQSFFLSPLTENARYGRGVNLTAASNKFSGGGFFLTPRFYGEINHEWGSFVRYGAGEYQHVQLNYLNKSLTGADATVQLASVSGQVLPLKQTVFKGEFSAGSNADGNLGQSALLQLESNLLKRVNFYGQVLWADTNFPGYFRNSLNVSGRLFYRPIEKIDLSLQVQKDDQNAALDTLFGVAPAINRKSLGFGYRMTKNSRITAQLRTIETEDKMPDQRFHIRNRSARLNWIYRKSQWQATIAGEWGTSLNLRMEPNIEESQVLRINFNGGYSPSQFLQLNLMMQYANQDYFLLDGTTQFIYGISAATRLRTGTRLRVHVQNSYLVNEYHRDRDLFSLQLGQKINKHHQVDVMARYALLRRTVNSRDISVSARYVWSFGIPLEKVQRGQDVYGRIVARDAQDKKGVVFYLNGQVAVTDKEGNFKFEGLQPGRYPLIIDRKSIGLHEITTPQMPITIEVAEDRPTEINLSLTKGVEISGQIVVQKQVGPGVPEEEQDMGVAIIEISKDDQVFRQGTNGAGKFSFSNLQPGTWTVRVIHGEIGKRFTLKDYQQTYELAPGAQQFIALELIPKKRKIQFSNFLSIKKDG